MEHAVTLVFDNGRRPIQYRVKGFKQNIKKRSKESQSLTGKALYKQQQRTNQYIEKVCHQLTKEVVKDCQFNGVGILVLGYNQPAADGKGINYWQYYYETFNRQIEQIAKSNQCQVEFVSEKGTSHASSLGGDSFEGQYTGQRYYRDYINSNGVVIDSDVNAAYNLLRKTLISQEFSQLITQAMPEMINEYEKVLKFS